MKPPQLSNGMHYGQGPDGKQVCRGAMMGRRNIIPHPGHALRWHLYRLRFIDGCYDQGGAYWGGPANLYRAVTTDGIGEVFVRAESRAEAKQQFKAIVPNAQLLKP